MPKLFPMYIEVEEIAVGKVIRLLNKTPGVATVDLERSTPKEAKPNGRGHYKPRGQFEVSGEEALETILHESQPLPTRLIGAEFAKQGRSAKSVHSLVHRMKTEGTIKTTPEGWILSRKAKDRIRHRIAAAKKKGGK